MKNILSILAFCLLLSNSAFAQPTANITVDTNIRHQVMTGWEGNAYIGQDHPNFALFAPRLPELFDSIVHQLGINRVKVEVRSGSENQRNYWKEYRDGTIDTTRWNCVRYSTINDNDDPKSIDWNGFHFDELDSTIRLIVLPLKQRLEAKGEKLFLNMNYVAYSDDIDRPECGDALHYFHADDDEEYAEFVLATYLHLRDTWGLVPDAWEVILEPDQGKTWRGEKIALAILSTAKRLQENGFIPRFIAPSVTGADEAERYLEDMLKVTEALEHLEEISYHGASTSKIAELAKQYGLKTAMLKHVGADYKKLHEDLSLGMNSAWSQFNLASPYYGEDSGSSYYLINFEDTILNFGWGSRTSVFMQYFRYIRKGDQRVDALSSHSNVNPLVFVSPDGFRKYVLKVDAPATINLVNIPGGQYSISFTSPGSEEEHVGPYDLEDNTTMTALVPEAGVLTVVQRSKVVADVERDRTIDPIRIINTSPLALSVTSVRSDVLEVFDMLGRKVFSTDVAIGNSNIFLPNLAKGAYTIRLVSDPASTVKITK